MGIYPIKLNFGKIIHTIKLSCKRVNVFYLCFVDAPFTIVIPKNVFEAANMDKANLQQFIFEHIIPGVQIKALRNGEVYGNLNRNPIEIKSLSPGRLTVNDISVLNFVSAKLISFIEIDGHLTDRKINFAKRNIQEHNR
jgi:hypothetical protein